MRYAAHSLGGGCMIQTATADDETEGKLPTGVVVTMPIVGAHQSILTPEALGFVAGLHRQFNGLRLELLAARRERQARFDVGEDPDFLVETADVRRRDWRVAPLPVDLQDRRVEITGPVDRKMVINALNSGANCYMADFEDSHSPTWDATIEGQINVRDAVNGTIEFVQEPIPGSGIA